MNLRYAPPAGDIARLEDEALDALQRGRERDSIAIWKRLLTLAPNHVRALTLTGQYAFRQGDFDGARRAFERAGAADGRDPRQWTSLAFACQRLRDESGEEQALFRAASADPADLLTLLLRGQLYERQGKARAAAASYGAATTVAPPLAQLSPDLRDLVLHAHQFREQHMQRYGAFVDETLDAAFRECEEGDNLARFRLSLDILMQRKRRFVSQPMQYFYPGLETVEFFDRSLFPWFEELESGTDTIREEFLNVLQTEQGFEPYITYAKDQPLNQWVELNNSPAWTAFHLVRDGSPVADNAGRCPRTMALWSKAPTPDQPRRTPAAMFSLLRPRTRIPPHTGSSNVRLVVHLPLIVPAGCRFRVGNSVREWVPGRCWAFDDTIEHEAWNDSDKLRVVLLFDVWHPALSAEERHMITALNAGMNRFNDGSDERWPT